MDCSNMASKRSDLQSIADAVVIAAVTSAYDTEEELKIYSKQFLTELGYPNTSLDITLTSDKTVIATPKAGYEILDEENSTNCRQVEVGEEAYTECDTYVYEERTRLAEWKGCMASRPNGHHKRPVFFGAHRLQGFVAHSSCNETFNELVPLSYDLPTINASVQALNTKSQTYIPAGLIWGWRTLDNRVPFTQNVVTENVDTQNIMLLMTDGSNSVSLRGTKPGFEGIYHWGESDNPEKAKQDADLLTSELCSSIKEDGIKIGKLCNVAIRLL